MGVVGYYFSFQNGYAFKSKDFVKNGKYAIIRIKELKDGSVKFFTDTARVNPEDGFNVNKYIVKKGDVLFALTGDPVNKPNPLSWVGRISYYNYDTPALLNQRVCKAIPKNKVSNEFLYYFFRQNEEFYNLASRATGSASQANISTKTIEQHIMEIPNEDIRKKIVFILLNIDKKIDVNNRINDNLEQQAQALFKAWFVEFEPFGGTMPSNWEICEAQKYFNINIGKTPPRNEMRWFSQKSTDCKWASISDLGKCGLFINDTSEYLTKDAVETFNIIVVPKGTILLSFKLTLGRVSITTCLLTTNEAIARFLINHDYEREYLYLLLKQFDYTSLGNTSSIATAVNSKIIRSMPIMMPTVDVLQRFHHIVSPIFTRMCFLSDEIMQLTDTRNTVLPQLMSGGLKINNLNC